jgi:succinyl-CoA synthetase beta subunit
MKIHEYQAKELCAGYGMQIPEFRIAESPEAAEEAARHFGRPVVVKAQVLTGGRGKAGGVKRADNAAEAKAAAAEILSLTIKDIPVDKVMVGPAVEIEKEYYLGIILDRSRKQLVLMLSASGGIDIEELAEEKPEEILRLGIDPVQGPDMNRLNELLLTVFGTQELAVQAREISMKLLQIFVETDASLMEINPLALTDEGRLAVLDAKVNFDDNGLYKHPDIEAKKNPEEYSEDEIEAKKHGLSFVSMEGDIGCIVNGAGLAMATMDIIKLFGGDPANFLDVGGSSNPEKVINALKIIRRNPKIKAILINIFGGITRCDDIARGILMAKDEVDLDLPLVIRLIGTNEEEGRRMLKEGGFEAAENLSDAVRKVVALAEGRAE